MNNDYILYTIIILMVILIGLIVIELLKHNRENNNNYEPTIEELLKDHDLIVEEQKDDVLEPSIEYEEISPEEEIAKAKLALEQLKLQTTGLIDETQEPEEDNENEDAIISIEELQSKENSIQIRDVENMQEEEMIPISIDELYETMEMPIIKIDEDKDLYDLSNTKEYPIIDIETLEREEKILREQERNKEILDQELKKTNEFLNFLKELKKNLK